MEAAVEFILDLVLYIFAGAFLLGFLLNLATGSGRALKVCLIGFMALFCIAAAIGLLLSGGLLIFLLFQLVIVQLLFLFTLFIGGLCGSGLRQLIRGAGARKTLAAAQLADHMPLADFSTHEGIEPERALARIRSGYYKGGSFGGAWYVHCSELTRDAPAGNGQEAALPADDAQKA